MELWQAMAALGQHRHPDYWHAPGTDDASPGAIASKGAPSADQRLAESRDLFAARRAAARGEGPPPQPDPRAEQGAGAVRSLLAGG